MLYLIHNKTRIKMATITNETRIKLVSDIRKIIDIDLAIDWSWFHSGIVQYLIEQGYNVSDSIDTDSLNAMKVSNQTIENFLESNDII